VFQFVPLAPGPFTGYHSKELAVFFTASNQIFVHIDEDPPSLLFAGLNSPSSQPFLIEEMLQSLHHIHGPFTES